MDEATTVERVRQSVEELCFCNMLLRILLQENWSPLQPLSPQATLAQARMEWQDTFRSRMPISDTTLVGGGSDLESVEIALQNVLRALEVTQQYIEQSVEKAKGA
jgi:hypothetical protein